MGENAGVLGSSFAEMVYDMAPSAFAKALLSGGDERLIVQADGLNKYGCAPRPRAAVELGSCTSSTLTEYAHLSAFSLWREICELPSATERSLFIEARFEQFRERLWNWLGASEELGEIVLTPSGTDAELVALHVMACSRSGKIRNVVVAPGEVGSGTLNAASCRHFADLTPAGEPSRPGEVICEALAERVETSEVEARSPAGWVRSDAEIEQELMTLASESSAREESVLLHSVAHSKTGIRVPGRPSLERLSEAYPDLVVLVDAAQGRLSRKSIRAHLERGHMVLFTGSKFFGGPTFSGALFVPKALSSRADAPMPSGYRAYFSASELPRAWPSGRESLQGRDNVGLLLRWEAALSEMDRFDSISATAQKEVIELYSACVEETFGDSDWIFLVRADAGNQEPTAGDAPIESNATVYNLRLEPIGGRPLDKSTLARWHGWLNRSLSGFLHHQLKSEEKLICDREFHLGQPVMISPGARDEQIAVLRIALGAPLLHFLAGLPPSERRMRLEEILVGLRDKLYLIRRFQVELGCAKGLAPIE